MWGPGAFRRGFGEKMLVQVALCLYICGELVVRRGIQHIKSAVRNFEWIFSPWEEL